MISIIPINSLLIFLVCTVISFLAISYRRRLSFIKAGNALPGPKPLPLIGNASYFLQKNLDDFLHILYTLAVNYPSPFRFWMGNKLFIGINDAEHAKIVLQSRNCLDKNLIYKFIKPLTGTGLLTASASVWNAHRKMIASSVNVHLRGFFDMFVKQSLVFIDELENIGKDGNEIDLHYYIHKCTMNIVFDATMGINSETQKNKNALYVEGIIRFKERLTNRARNLFLYSDYLFNLTPDGFDQRKCLRSIHSFADEVIQQKLYALNNPDTKEIEIDPKAKFLDVIMKASNDELGKQKYTRQDIHDEINTMLLGGSDTTSTMVNFTIFMLATFPEIQKKVYEELFNIYGNKSPRSAPIKYEDLQHMGYLERVIKETLRLFPVGPIIGRHLTKDLQIGEFTLPKGADIIIGIITMHRNEKYWSNPLTFDPDRFLAENSVKRHPYCYLPFSGGLRTCIGMKFAMMSLKVILATAVRAFVLKVDKSVEISKIKLNMDLLLNTVEPLKVKIEKRNFQ